MSKFASLCAFCIVIAFSKPENEGYFTVASWGYDVSLIHEVMASNKKVTLKSGLIQAHILE